MEVESVAYVIGKRYGLESSSSAFAYIHNWAQGDTAAWKGTAESVVKACKETRGHS